MERGDNLFKEGDRVEIISCKYFGHNYPIGTICEVLHVRKSSLGDGENYELELKRIDGKRGYVHQVCHSSDVRLYINKEKYFLIEY